MELGPRDRTALSDLAERLGAPLRMADPVGWGDARATHRLSLADGRQFAARRFAGPASLPRAERTGRLMARLAQVGLPVPSPTILDMPDGPWLVTGWVEGETGARWLDDPDRARHLADRMGRLASRLRTIDLGSLDLEDRASAVPADGEMAKLGAFVHGDFAPVNVVLDVDGEIAALVDFEHAGPGPALLDVAWWGWVVRHHHPAAWTAAWPAFLAAAGLEPGRIEVRLRELVLRTLADRAAAADGAEARRRWLDRLAAARVWQMPADQAT